MKEPGGQCDVAGRKRTREGKAKADAGEESTEPEHTPVLLGVCSPKSP